MSPFPFFGGDKGPSVRVNDPTTESVWFESNEVDATWDSRGPHRFLRVFATQRSKKDALKSFLTLSLRFFHEAPASTPVDGRMQHNGSMNVFDGPLRGSMESLTLEEDSIHGTLEGKAYMQEAHGEDPTIVTVEFARIQPETDRKFVDNLETIVRTSPAKFPDILHWFDLSDEQRRHRRIW